MKLTDERRKALTEYLGEPEATSEYTVANSGDLVSVRTVIQNRTFDTDADMMALFRKLKDNSEFTTFWHFAVSKDRNAVELDWLFYNAERFCNLVAEWLEVKK